MAALLGIARVGQAASPPASDAPPAPGQAEGAAIGQTGWLPRGTAELRALDKISARLTSLDIRVGGSAAVGSLTVAVRGCLVRPPDQPADAAAFLEITDSRGGNAGFRGWMFANEPAVAVLENSIYDVRVVGCRA